jgi:nucleoside-diphosphate-sugar epimerase
MREDLVLEPLSDYGVSKAASTQYCLKEALFNKLPIYTIRPFSIYGNYEAATRLFPSVILNSLQDKELNLSAPHYVRDYVYIDDMVDIYMAIATQKPKEAYVFNAGTGTQYCIKDVVNTVGKILNKEIKTLWGTQQPRPWEPKTWVADTHLAQQVLGWKSKYSLELGIRKTIQWFENNLYLYNSAKEYYERTIFTQSRPM